MIVSKDDEVAIVEVKLFRAERPSFSTIQRACHQLIRSATLLKELTKAIVVVGGRVPLALYQSALTLGVEIIDSSELMTMCASSPGLALELASVLPSPVGIDDELEAKLI